MMVYIPEHCFCMTVPEPYKLPHRNPDALFPYFFENGITTCFIKNMLLNYMSEIALLYCNTVERSNKIYNGQIHRLPYIATINNFPWAALPND